MTESELTEIEAATARLEAEGHPQEVRRALINEVRRLTRELIKERVEASDW